MFDELPHLIKRCCKGERAAQGQVYALLRRKMIGVCLWYAKSKEEAEEILQDGFVQVFVHIRKFRNDGPFEAWVRKIMVNTALQKYRLKKNSNLRAVVEFDVEKHATAEDAGFLARIDEKQLLAQIQLLPPVYRMVFNLNVFEGFTHKEIAALLGISEGTSKSNLSDARAILRKKIVHQQKVANL